MIKKLMLRSLIVMITIMITTVAFEYALALSDKRYSYDEMDLNNDGVVGLTEATYVSHSGTRELVVVGSTCLEYFSFKDGLALKVLCP